MLFQIVHWDANPEIFSIGFLTIRWYGLLFASSFIFGYIIMNRIFKNENLGEEVLDRLTVYMALGTIIGARLGHCLFYDPVYYLSNIFEMIFPFGFENGKLVVTGYSGLASHGAAIGILTALWFFAKKERKDYAWILDRIVITVALAGFLIRIANLMNSEVYGIETAVPWGFVFLRNYEIVPKHPTQIYEALVCLATFILLYKLYWIKKGAHYQGLLISLFLILIFGSRFFIEFVKEDQVAFEAAMKLNMGQLLSIPFVFIGSWGLYKTLKIKKKAVIKRKR